MGIIKRIANGTTTYEDAEKVQALYTKRIAAFVLVLVGGILLGAALMGLLT